MKRMILAILAATLTSAMLTACGTPQNGATNAPGSTSAASESIPQEFSIYYPSYMQEAEGEKLVLPKKPEKIIALSNSAMQILVRCDVKPIAFRKAPDYINFPDWVRELPTIETGMNGLDLETVISMEPDLVIMGTHLKADYSEQLKAAGIPVYYTSEGPAIAYPEIKEEAIMLARSFGSEEMGKEIHAEFEAVEKRMQDMKQSSKTAMILFGAPPSHQQTSKSYLGSILSMMPFENLSDTLVDVNLRMAPIDMEKLVVVDPEVIFAISPTAASADEIQKLYEKEFANNPQTWNALQAVQNDTVIYLSNEYVTSKGIHIINSINNLLDMLEEKLA